MWMATLLAIYAKKQEQYKSNVPSAIGSGTAENSAKTRIGRYIYLNVAPTRTYHLLVKAMTDNVVPTHEQTLEDWGFNRCASEDDRCYLLGVYIGLWKILEIPMREVDGWRRKGTLFKEIKKIHDEQSVGERGQYMPWLMQNPQVIPVPQRG
ncbi:hypothetical protein DFP72DRAFT_8286 [Ephemerocybe angulata]|uniref:Uncharacterized protein n=1 Tax=Ephemerocybe angulata TaxID=980116 RepID=A0A8H6MHB6_9AGAR|nr:hypothetical protein DFP72DRAFT_8286 [Tulosesus angulatus]